MNTPQRLMPIIILLFVGCEEPPAPAPHLLPQAAEQTRTPAPPAEPATLPDATTEAQQQVDEITGKVIHIVDGDTIDILTADKKTIRIRLNGIDAPETGQPFGRNAKEFVSDFIGGQTVRVVTFDKDRYGRLIGDIYMKDEGSPNALPGATLPGWNINREIVQNGLAWHYKKYSSDIYLEMDEVTARDRKLG